MPEGSNRVKRGGSWNNNARNCRSADRDWNYPDGRGDYVWLYKEYPHVWVLPVAKRKFNPLQVQDGVPPKEHAATFTRLFCNAFYIMDVGQSLLLHAVLDL